MPPEEADQNRKVAPEEQCDIACSCTEDRDMLTQICNISIANNFTVLTCWIVAKLLKSQMSF